MKKPFLLLALTVLSLNSQAQSVCPKNWPVTIVESKNSKTISIIVAENLIRNEQLIGGITLGISSEFSPWVEIKGNAVDVNFAHKVGSVVTEKWSPLGSITETEVADSKICHKLQVAKGVVFNEIVEYASPDCMGLPRWMCGKKAYHSLKITKPIDGKEYYTKSTISVEGRR